MMYGRVIWRSHTRIPARGTGSSGFRVGSAGIYRIGGMYKALRHYEIIPAWDQINIIFLIIECVL